MVRKFTATILKIALGIEILQKHFTMGKHLLTIITLILFSIVGMQGQGVSINEVMPCNISTQINTDNYNFSGYIELFNGGEKSVNLKGMVLTHFKKKGNGELES